MSTKNNAIDNAVREFLWYIKRKTICTQKVRTLAGLIRTVEEYIYWCNNYRIKLTLGGYFHLYNS